MKNSSYVFTIEFLNVRVTILELSMKELCNLQVRRNSGLCPYVCSKVF